MMTTEMQLAKDTDKIIQVLQDTGYNNCPHFHPKKENFKCLQKISKLLKPNIVTPTTMDYGPRTWLPKYPHKIPLVPQYGGQKRELR